MPKYFFHIRDGNQLIEDREGINLPNVMTARQEAELAAREILADKVKSGEVIDGQEFEVHDKWGNPLLTLPFRSVLRLFSLIKKGRSHAALQ